MVKLLVAMIACHLAVACVWALSAPSASFLLTHILRGDRCELSTLALAAHMGDLGEAPSPGLGSKPADEDSASLFLK